MKKILLSICALLAGAANVCAQDIFYQENLIITKVSEDGKLSLAADGEGTLYLWNTETGDVTVFESGDDGLHPFYMLGFGKPFDKNGNFVANYDQETPAIYKDGEWVMLPTEEGDTAPGMSNSADDITPDGKRICGGIARDKFGIDAENVMMAPVIWDMQADGTYGMYKVLPYPTKDFTGRTPQYVTARQISDDGKTIIGQVRDYSGFYVMPIVYREDENGEWSYEMLGADLIYNKDVQFPEWPKEPKLPNPLNYMSEADYADYQDAVAAYEQAVSDFFAGIIDEYPSPVNAADYISDPDQKAAYDAAYAQYQADFADYQAKVDAFHQVEYDPEMVYGTQFGFNSMVLSPDGKYAADMFTAPAEDPDPDYMGWGPQVDYKVTRFDLTAEGNPYTFVGEKNAAPTDFLADGSVVYTTPVDDYVRDTYIVPDGETEGLSLIDFVAQKNPEMAEDLKDAMTYTSVLYDPATWEEMPGEEVVKTGMCVANNDGTVFAGWNFNGFYAAGDWTYLGYVINVNTPDGIQVAEKSNEVSSYVVADVTGKELYRGQNAAAARKAFANGVNILTTVFTDGTSKSIKVIKK